MAIDPLYWCTRYKNRKLLSLIFFEEFDEFLVNMKLSKPFL